MDLSTVLLLIASAIHSVGTYDYAVAYRRAIEGDEPLLVLVTAESCGPCQQMKATTIADMLSQNKFEGFNFAMVALGRERKLGRRLTRNQSVPQLIVMKKRKGHWTLRRLVGVHSVASVEAFLGKSGPGGHGASVAVSR